MPQDAPKLVGLAWASKEGVQEHSWVKKEHERVPFALAGTELEHWCRGDYVISHQGVLAEKCEYAALINPFS